MLEPRLHKMALLGLGRSVGTPKEGLKGEVLVVSSFDELTARAAEAKGKIIVFNAVFTTYGQTVAYRGGGASAAAKVGGIAALVRSVTPYSLYTPHTGAMGYQDGIPKVPTAAITIEDAEMMKRMQDRGQQVVVHLYMEAYTGPDVTSANVLAEIPGSTSPEQIIVMGGHIDSWDVGNGAMDDGGGLLSSWEALRLLHDMIGQGLLPAPNRTIRLVLWVNEEMGARGGQTYYEKHAAELPNHVLAIESDEGNFDPVGFGFTGTKADYSTISDLLGASLGPIGSGNVTFNDGEDTDDSFLIEQGVAGASLTSTGFGEGLQAFYFNYHHSNADSITVLNKEGLAKSAAAFAVLSYTVATLDQSLEHWK